MGNSWAAKAAAGLVLFLMFNSCGEFDSILPVSQSYQVSATTESYSLEEYAGIRQHDKIRPYFVDSISGDQDITGLTVFLQTPDGKQRGEKVHYCVEEPEEEAANGAKLIRVAAMDLMLPDFPLPEDLEIGSYTMVFHIVGGKGNVFSKTEKALFYLGASDYSIDEIAAYLSGHPSDSYLIAPGTAVMLDAKVSAGEGLAPYIVWYDGKKKISEKSVSGGRDSLLWEIPEGNGFRLLRAEVFPFPPAGKNSAPGARSQPGETGRGKAKELSLPVSRKGETPEYFSRQNKGKDEFTRYYLFAGDLRDSINPRPENALTSTRGSAPQWLYYGGIYGLAVGPLDVYSLPQDYDGELPSASLRPAEFRFRCKLLGDGSVFSAFLPGCVVNLSREEQNLVLTLRAEGKSGEAAIETALSDGEDFVAFTLRFGFRDKGLSAALALEGMPHTEAFLDLAGAPTAGQAASYQLGAPRIRQEEDEPPAGEESGGLPVLILDELALTYGSEE
jgi:hypothetical protein